MSKQFKPSAQYEVDLISCLWIQEKCEERKKITCTKEAWNTEMQNILKNASSIVRKLVPKDTLHYLKMQCIRNQPRPCASYAMIEERFKELVTEMVSLLVKSSWNVFSAFIDERIDKLIDKLESIEFYNYVLNFSMFSRMDEYVEYEDESSEDVSDEDEDEDERDSEDHALDELLSILVNDIKRQSKHADVKKNQSDEAKELIALLQNRKSPSKAIDFNLFDEMKMEEKKGLIDTLKKVNMEKSTLPMLFRLLKSSLPVSVINEAMQRFESCRSESESTKYMTWVNSVLNLPFNTFVEPAYTKKEYFSDVQKSKAYFENARKQLDEVVFGHDTAKNHLIKYIAQMTRHGLSKDTRSKGLVLGIQGPCGNGKTTLIEKGVSKILGLPFAAIPLGGATDNAFLNGHSYTYEGSVWGQIADVLMKTKCSNPIIYMDELDKISNCHKGQEIVNQLIHLTDPSQNSHFQDRYFGNIDIDLSHVTFIFSYNDASNINYILRDRITEVKTSGFTLPDKLQIAQKFLVPSVCSDIGMPVVSFSDDTIKYMIESYTYEGGVRKIKELIFDVCRSLNMDDLCGNIQLLAKKRRRINESGSYIVSMVKVCEYLKHKQLLQKEKIHKIPAVGRVNGMYASSLIDMGGIIPIEASFVPSDNVYGFSQTGNLGKVMKESGNVAKTLAWKMLNNEVQEKWANRWKLVKESIHLHCPEGAVNKDGPSAGTALTITILSLLTNNKIQNDVAITGEINLSGDVMAIGGLRSKLYGAKHAGCTLALFPSDNIEDYNKIRQECHDLFDDTFRVVPVSTLSEVIPHVFDSTDGFSKELSNLKTVAKPVRKTKKSSSEETQQHGKRKYNTRSSS